MNRMKIGSILAESGSRSKGLLKVAARPDGTELGIPVMVVNGSGEGPVLLVDSTCHGDEPEGAMAIIQVAQSLDPSKLKGTLIGIPVLNVESFAYRERIHPFDRYYPDMNRVWPGKESGSISERIAYVYFTEVVRKANFVWAMHGGGNIQYMAHRTIVDPSLEGALRIAKGLGPEWNMLAIRREQLPTSLVGACNRLGIPCVITELGGAGDRMPERLLYHIASYRRALENLLKHLGMVEGQAEYPKGWRVVEYSIPLYRNGGLAIPEPKCRIGETVRKGDVLVKVFNLFGEVVETIEAPHDGIVIGVPVCPNAYPGNQVVTVGEIKETIT